MNPTLTFWAAAAGLSALALMPLLSALWRGPGLHRANGGAIDILREQMAGIERDLASGRLPALQAERLREEVGRRMLQEQGTRAAWQGGAMRPMALALAVLVPLAAASMYAARGNLLALTQAERAPATAGATATQVETLVNQMITSLRERDRRGESEASDAGAWGMIAYNLAALQRFAEADQALERALQLQPGNALLMAERADILGLLRGGSLEGEPMRLVEAALAIDPGQPKALALAGSAARSRGDLTGAIVWWERAIAALPAGSEFAQTLARDINAARQAQASGGGPLRPAGPGMASPRLPGSLPSPGALTAAGAGVAATTPSRAAPQTRFSVQGRITVAPELIARLRPEDTVFIVARKAGGPRMPLAVLRLKASDLPASFTLDERHLMGSGSTLSQQDSLILTARISRTGEPTARAGDLYARPTETPPTAQGVLLRIDQREP